MEIASKVHSINVSLATPVPVGRADPAPDTVAVPSAMVNYLNFAAPAFKVQPADGTVFLVMRDAVTGRVHDTILPPTAAVQYQQNYERVAQQQPVQDGPIDQTNGGQPQDTSGRTLPGGSSHKSDGVGVRQSVASVEGRNGDGTQSKSDQVTIPSGFSHAKVSVIA